MDANPDFFKNYLMHDSAYAVAKQGNKAAMLIRFKASRATYSNTSSCI